MVDGLELRRCCATAAGSPRLVILLLRIVVMPHHGSALGGAVRCARGVEEEVHGGQPKDRSEARRVASCLEEEIDPSGARR